jgi:phosphocarrier protein
MSQERESVRGLDEFGIPAPLFHAVGARLRQRGVEVWGRGGVTEEWILLANAETFYGWVRKSEIPRVCVRAAGPQESDVCRELCALLDVGDPSIVLRAGFVEVKWTSNPEFFVAHVESQRPGLDWTNAFWRSCEGHAGQSLCTWGKCGDVRSVTAAPSKAAQCSIFCPHEALSSQVRDNLNTTAIEASREVMVTNKLGMHSPHCARFFREARGFESDIIVTRKAEASDPQWLNGKVMMNLMWLSLGPGSHLVMRAWGQDAQQAVDHLAALVARRFDREND